MSEGGDASRSTDVAVLKELIGQRFDDLEKRLDERRVSDQAAVIDTYVTKENLRTLETLIDQRLELLAEKARAIETAVGMYSTQRITARGVWSDLRSVIVSGFIILAGVIGLITYLAQN